MRKKQLPFCLRALGQHDLPERIEVAGQVFRHVRTFKHDFFAATAQYEGDGRQVVLKVGRRVRCLGLPLGWIGRLLARHEADMLRRFADLDGVPALVGMWGDDAIVHEFIPGRPLAKGERVADDFFERLGAMIRTIHEDGAAYVDLEKPQNVLVGDDGRPYLIDFQISWPWPIGWVARTLPGRWLRHRLQQGDLYHHRKLHRRFRRDQLTPEQLAASYRRPWPVRLHQKLTRPLTRLRRWILIKLGSQRHGGERGRIEDDHAAPATR